MSECFLFKSTYHVKPRPEKKPTAHSGLALIPAAPRPARGVISSPPNVQEYTEH